MASNVIHDSRGFLSLELDVGASGSAGDFATISEMPVHLITDTDANDLATVVIPSALVVDVSVTGADNAGNSAVAVGDKIYNDGGTLNKDSVNGTFHGYALETISSGNTDTINVALASG